MKLVHVIEQYIIESCFQERPFKDSAILPHSLTVRGTKKFTLLLWTINCTLSYVQTTLESGVKKNFLCSLKWLWSLGAHSHTKFIDRRPKVTSSTMFLDS